MIEINALIPCDNIEQEKLKNLQKTKNITYLTEPIIQEIIVKSSKQELKTYTPNIIPNFSHNFEIRPVININKEIYRNRHKNLYNDMFVEQDNTIKEFLNYKSEFKNNFRKKMEKFLKLKVNRINKVKNNHIIF